MRQTVFASLLLLLAACHDSGGSSDPELGRATIGPAGGEVAITSGDYAGLRLQVPAGALLEPTELRIFDDLRAYIDGTLPLSYAPPIGLPFRIEPPDLRFEVLATLQVPYRVAFLNGTAPGNVRARQVRNGNAIDVAPRQVDVVAGRVELNTRTLGSFRIVQGPTAPGIAAYQQAIGTSVALAGGYSFAVEEVPSTSPFAAVDAVRWRIRGPGVEDVLYFAGDAVRARESIPEDWRETWNEPFPVWSYGPLSVPPGTFTTLTQVSQPISQPGIGATMTASGGWVWSEPRFLGTELVYDVLELRLNLAGNRSDLGVGQRAYRFWFAPGQGLLGFSQDGVARERPTP